MTLINSIVATIYSKRLGQIEFFKKKPVEVQEKTLRDLLKTAANTEFGKQYSFSTIKNSESFAKNIPIHEYDSLKPYIEKSVSGTQNVLWPTPIKWYAKSSGTTADRSKYIPISKESLQNCHFRSGKDIYAIYIDKFPDSKIFLGKTLSIGGSTSINKNISDSYSGDLSAIIIKNLPFWTFYHRIPNAKTALIDEWDKKLKTIVETTYKKNVTNIVGVPSWLMVLLKMILEYTGKNDILEIWPNMELFIHGGVSFAPYKNIYEKLIPTTAMTYLETYNASEGFFGLQDEFYLNNPDLLLMLDYGIYYEFIELSDYIEGKNNSIPLADVKTNVNYTMIISTNGGLWRYVIGDTICFTSTNPYRFKITGRTRHYINAFGEEVVMDNAHKAVTYACETTSAEIREYTAAPIFYENGVSQGAHEWIFEFVKAPEDIHYFVELIDKKIRELNSDYDAKRFKDITLGFPKYTIVKEGTFYSWLKTRGKLGGQNKIPRLSNTR
ncbi:GH3 auxin-responsive promoter family protein, partial [Bacteroidales bacterium OttesenSCG-928-I21]|nr:GH3 auxin-responsive promoter family protein [Bacteroidales bacterium OttesenSCG-928-I21]